LALSINGIYQTNGNITGYAFQPLAVMWANAPLIIKEIIFSQQL
jgi:hypothetical protein